MLGAELFAPNLVGTLKVFLSLGELADVPVCDSQGLANRSLDQRLLLKLVFQFLRRRVKKRTHGDFPPLGNVGVRPGQQVVAQKVAHRLRGSCLPLGFIAGGQRIGTRPSRLNGKHRRDNDPRD